MRRVKGCMGIVYEEALLPKAFILKLYVSFVRI